jgi:hypothetical protein
MIAKEKAMIKYKRYLSQRERNELLEGLKFFLGESILFFDVIAIVEQIEAAVQLM